MTPLYLRSGIVLIHRTDTSPSQWCALRAADVGERIITTCLAELDYGPVNVQVVRPGEDLPRNMCPQCKRHVEVQIAGACVPVEQRRTTRDLRKRAVTGVAWAPEDAATQEEWSESAIPEVVLAEMTSRGTRRCCARMQYGDGSHDLGCRMAP